MIARACGAAVAVRGGLVEAELPYARVGDGVRIGRLAARVVALQGARALLAPFEALGGVALGTPVAVSPEALAVPLGTPLLGRALDARGSPLDGGPAPRGRRRAPETASAALAERRPCAEPCWTGVRAIDGPLAFGRGARVGLFGAPGAGKTTLLEAVVRHAAADAVVVGLVGERGREAERWLARVDARTTLVCATGDRPAVERVRAGELAFAQAEALRARGLDVLLVVDSLARICAAAREVALAAGEPAGRGGYPAGVFATLAGLLERAGRTAAGSVTLIATVLADGPEAGDPVAVQARAALDGHLVLSEALARAGRFPALDVPASASRTFSDVATAAHRAAAASLRAALAALEESREARALGLNPAASDPVLARAVSAQPRIAAFLEQGGEPSPPERTLTELIALADTLR